MKSRNFLIVGNWKMNPDSLTRAVKLFSEIDKNISLAKNIKAVICPPSVYLPALHALKSKRLTLGAQDVSEFFDGSHTGEVTAAMLKSASAHYVIVGHSERRAYGETDDMVNAKVQQALSAGLKPIICVGEEKRDEEGHYLAFVKHQIERALAGVSKTSLQSIVFAYEPVFAIGSNRALDSRSVHEMSIFIKKTIVDFFRLKSLPEISILYGGAVDPLNAFGILGDGQADGLLIGRQSLEAKNFAEIISLVKTI